jgi:anhydro-N-acetylmuramic acid kinase
MIEHDNFIEIKPPKSTGREYYGKEFISAVAKKIKNVKPEDWIATASKFTAYAIYRNYKKFIENETQIEELFVSGGGARNKFLIKELKNYFGKQVSVANVKELGISPDAKEAICFAILANETLSGNPSNITRVTGAKRSAILGKISLP